LGMGGSALAPDVLSRMFPPAPGHPELRLRFVREAQAAAGLSHPHIVPVFETGELGALCYLISAYCAGGTLAHWLQGQTKPVAIPSAAALVALLADAVQHAHARGILHRDLKPSNVLLEFTPGAPAHAGARLGFVPRLTDFGLAKFLEREPEGTERPENGVGPGDRDGWKTRTGALVGTPRYMAPEQAEGRRAAIGPATDVYGLGAILYELLAGRPPFVGETDLHTLRQVVEDEPVPPRHLRPAIPRDLEAICLRCLEKRPERRYATAAALAQDLRHFLDGKPTVARPATFAQRLGKWIRRRPAAAALLATISVALTALTFGAVWHYAQLRAYTTALAAQQQRAEERNRQARRQAYVSTIGLAWSMWRDGRAGFMGELLNQHRPGPGENDLRGFEWHYLWRRARSLFYLHGHRGGVHSVAFSPDGKLCASGSRDGTVKLWDVATGKLHGSLLAHSTWVFSIAFSPDGQRLASGGSDSGHAHLQLWEVATGQRQASLSWSVAVVLSVAFSPDGRLLTAAGQTSEEVTEVRLWDLLTGREWLLWRQPRQVTYVVAISPDGKTLAAASTPLAGAQPGPEIRLWDLTTHQQTGSLQGHLDRITCLAFAPDGQTLASGSFDKTVKLWDLGTGQERRTLLGHEEELASLSFTPDGTTLATGTWPQQGSLEASTVRLWDVASGRERGQPWQPGCAIHSLAVAPDGQTFALACSDRLVCLWDPGKTAEAVALAGHPKEAWCVAFSPDGRTLVSGSDDHTAKLWDVATGLERVTLHGHKALVMSAAFAPGGQLLVTGSYDTTVKLWDPSTGQELRTLAGHAGPVRAVAFAPDGQTLATGSDDHSVKLWDVATGQMRLAWTGHEDKIRGVVFTPDGSLLVTCGNDETVRLWDAATGEALRTLPESGDVQCLALSPDGRTLATGIEPGVIRLWDRATGQEQAALLGHVDDVLTLAFAPDGKTLASASKAQTIKLWHVATGRELLTFKKHKHQVNGVAFSPDGKILASAWHDGSVLLWSGDGGE
ncbi:MAG: protein kinase, partial [Gemmataceae bacterium]|nr:protein kinase [Gemmataceae bacterium]